MSKPAAPREIPATKGGVDTTGNTTAPFIYLDGVATYGTQSGVIQIEVAARTILPTADGGTKIEFVLTGHLRFGTAGALALKDAIEKCFEMMKKPDPAPTGVLIN